MFEFGLLGRDFVFFLILVLFLVLVFFLLFLGVILVKLVQLFVIVDVLGFFLVFFLDFFVFILVGLVVGLGLVEVGVAALDQFLGGIDGHLAVLVQAVGYLAALGRSCQGNNKHKAQEQCADV